MCIWLPLFRINTFLQCFSCFISFYLTLKTRTIYFYSASKIKMTEYKFSIVFNVLNVHEIWEKITFLSNMVKRFQIFNSFHVAYYVLYKILYVCFIESNVWILKIKKRHVFYLFYLYINYYLFYISLYIFIR